MRQYHVTGMSCAACSARVEKAVNAVPGVKTCSVSLLTNSMGVEGEATPEQIIQAVEAAGYGATLKEQQEQGAGGVGRTTSAGEDELRDMTTPKLKKCLIASSVFLVALMYFSMGHMMWSWPLPAWFADNHVAMGLVQMILAAIIMVINQRFFVSGWKGIVHRAPNMDTLVAMGAGVAFGWSVYVLFRMTGAQAAGDMDAVMTYMDEFYFESAGMILTLITVGTMLEARSKGKTTNALKSLMKLAPKEARIFVDGQEKTVPIEQVAVGDIVVIRPGDSIPVDGIVLEGGGAVNEAALTGESIPADKSVGDNVSAATINQSGYMKCRATRVGRDTTLSQIIQMVSDASATKAPIAKIADRVSGIFVPTVIGIAAITTIVWLIIGAGIGFALARGISVLVISCPCALGLATPVAIMVGNGVGAKSGILFKTAVSLEAAGRLSTIALDKTGTITLGEPTVREVVTLDAGYTDDDFLQLAASLEQGSEHPLAKAVLKYSDELAVKPQSVTDFTVLPGNGLEGRIAGTLVRGGSIRYMSEHVKLTEAIRERATLWAEEGMTPVLFAREEIPVGMIAIADKIKEDSSGAIRELRDMGLHVVMLTGDNEKTAAAIGQQAGVDEVFAGVLPDGKADVIANLQQTGNGMVAMVGDGINDAPALTVADVGIAIGAGADVAIDAADVVLMKNSLRDVAAAVRIGRATLRNIHENLFWAFIYNIIGIPLAAGVLVAAGITMNPMFGAAAMSLSSFCVVSNALRLNLCKPYGKQQKQNITEAVTITDTKSENKESEDYPMTKTIKITGMMCMHCEAHVKKALEAIDNVESAVADHTAGTAVVTLTGEVADEALTAAVTEAGYTVDGIC